MPQGSIDTLPKPSISIIFIAIFLLFDYPSTIVSIIATDYGSLCFSWSSPRVS